MVNRREMGEGGKGWGWGMVGRVVEKVGGLGGR